MSQEPSVLLVDLPDQGVPFAQALNQVGRPSVFLAPLDIAGALKEGRPLGIVALARDVSLIAECIRAQNYPNQLPFFVLQDDAPGSIRPPLPEVTAVVPEGVEPGILALRIQQALQQIGGPRPRQTTVLGMGSLSTPQALPSQEPSKPAAQSPASPPASKERPASAPPFPSTAPPEVPWDNAPEPAVVSSAPPVVPKSGLNQALSSAKPAVVSSAPPLPDIQSLTPSAPFIPDAAPLPADVQKSLSELSSSPTSALPEQPSAQAAPTHPPVALNPLSSQRAGDLTLDEDETAMKSRSWMPRALAAAGIVAALGVGGMVLFGKGGGDEADESAGASPEVVSQTAKEKSPASAAASPPQADKPADSEKALDVADAAKSSPDAVTGEGALFQIERATTMDSCEKTLGKSASDFASAKKWQASQSWKLARKSLMAGKEDAALEHMCEASFIDASGPATVGLAKYYLGRRGLEQAHSWAEKAVDAASGANSKRIAQQVLGDVLSQMGKVEEARRIWLESFNLTADQTDRLGPVVRNFINAAVKARKGGDPALAEQLLRRATTFQPDNVNASALLAATLLENGEKKLAKLWAERALKKKPGLDMAEEVLKSLGG